MSYKIQERAIKVNPENCVSCKPCPVYEKAQCYGALEFNKKGRLINFDETKCKECYTCYMLCKLSNSPRPVFELRK